MSDTTHDATDIQAIVSRIDRDLSESIKLREETRKFVSEQHKLNAEAEKLNAEALKLERDRRLSPWLAAVAVTGGIGGIIAGATAIARLAGWIS
jgi:hypothetical protein